ncbi:MAG TPA: hypothetical protein VF247_05645 [Candidatus Krumholzibacteria bacterium]
MRRWFLLMAMGLLVAGCKPQHPVNVYVNDSFDETREGGGRVVEKIAVLDCTSSLSHADDPDNLAPKTMAKYLMPALQTRSDYKFIATNTVSYAIEKTSNADAYAKFLRSYAMTDKPDMGFLAPLAAELNCDAFLIPVVDLWQKDEVDITENATPATYVGATITVVSAKDGAMLFRCTDEDYIEGAGTSTDDRSLVTSSSGAVRADLGAKTHRAPPFEDVAVKVSAALVSGLPSR